MDDYLNPAMYETGVLTGRVNGSEMRISVLGSDHEIQNIAPSLHHLTALPKKTKDGSGELSLPLTWAIVTQCARLAEQYHYRWKPSADLSAWIYEEFSRRFAEYKDPSDLKFDVSSLEWEPMPHQLAGAYVGALNRRLFFADDMGTGKTRTALLTLAEMEARGLDPFPAFVVAPASVVDPWMEELEACFPDWTFTAYRGPRRKSLSTRYQIYVMSWDVFRTDMQPPEIAECPHGHGMIEWKRRDQRELDKHLMGQVSVPQVCTTCQDVMLPVENKTELPALLDFLVPRTVVFDEAHALCNTKTRQSVAARRISRVSAYTFPMSGTPITNDLGGFWSALNVLDTRSFPDQERYKERYTDRFKKDYGQEEISGLTTVNREEFYTLMQGTMRRVSKKDVLKDLPDKTYSTRVVNIPAAFRAAYDEMEEDMIAHIPDTEEPLPVMNTLAQLQRLSQLASSACDVEIEYVLDDKPDSLTFGEEVPHYKVSMREPCWKVDELMAIMAENEGQPLVTFAPHAQLMNIAGKRAESHGYRVGYIKGGQSQTQRSANRLRFQAGEFDLLCVTTSAGGVGLTLTASHTAVFLERPWAYWQSTQSEDRLHRRGQLDQVHIIDVIARNTVEDRVRQAIKDKARNLSELVRDPHIFRTVLGGK